jgi:hypothetical protein
MYGVLAVVCIGAFGALALGIGMIVTLCVGGAIVSALMILSAILPPPLGEFCLLCIDQMGVYLKSGDVLLGVMVGYGSLMLFAMHLEIKKETAATGLAERKAQLQAEEEEFDYHVSLAVWKAPWLDSE